MMGRQRGDQSQLFYLFNLERHIPAGQFLRRINLVVTRILVDLRDRLAAFYSDIGRPSIDPELMIRMLIVGYCCFCISRPSDAIMKLRGITEASAVRMLAGDRRPGLGTRWRPSHHRR